jgi:transglutaminase-like putative cysteine protease
MLLNVRHRTQYRYADQVSECVMEVRLQPPTSYRQRLLSFNLAVEPKAQLFSYEDHLGNVVHHFDVPQPHDELTMTAQALVETIPPPDLPVALAPAEWEALDADTRGGAFFDYLRPHGFATASEKLAGFMAESGLNDPRGVDPLSAVWRLSERMKANLRYAPGASDVESPIDEALEARSGVCQDFSHIMITICRSWGIPARYVSGYAYEAKKSPAAETSHAWVELYLPSLQWVGFDPAKNRPVNEGYVAVAIGLDYSDVPPTRGVYKGDADSELLVAVDVRPPQQEAKSPDLTRLFRGRPQAQKAPKVDAPYREYQQQQQ